MGPGYVARSRERAVVMFCEPSHKVLRSTEIVNSSRLSCVSVGAPQETLA
jgi:hypothetical protein